MTSSQADTCPPSPIAVAIADGEIEVTLDDGRRIATPLEWYPALLRATREQRQNFELMPFGIHWPDIDEDLSVEGMLRGARGIDWQRRIPAE